MKKLISIIASAFRQAPVLSSVTAFFFLCSLTLLIVSIPLGLAFSHEVDKTALEGQKVEQKALGFVQKTNWSFQPLFWLIYALLIHLSWKFYADAWRSLPSHGVLWKGNQVYSDSSATQGVIAVLQKTRPYIVVISIGLGLIFTAVDAGCLWSEYGVIGSEEGQCKERDFCIAFRLAEFPNVGSSDMVQNGMFVLAAYLLQGGLIACAWIVTLQLIINSIYFLTFEACSANKEKLRLRLNYRDPLREFGLGDVNRAINITYSMIALGMILPVLSAYNNPDPDRGQWLLRTLVPIVLIIPAIVPIVERTRRVKDASERLREDKDPMAQDDYANQKLWPFLGTQISYVGNLALLIILGEYTYLFTRNFIDFL